MPTVHASAVIEQGAAVAADAEIGPYCVIGPNVTIAAGCRLVAHVHITGHTTIGPGTVIAPFASLGTPPQSTRYRGGPTRLVIGANCDIREAVTMNTGTEDDHSLTVVGDRCLFMVNAHVGHDVRIGNDVTISNNVALGGHVTIGSNVVIGGQSGVHQFGRVGEGAMVSGHTGVAADIIPFGLAVGQRAVLDGLNIVGMRRRGFSRTAMHQLRHAYRLLFFGGGLFRDRLDRVERDFADDPLVGKIIAFIREDSRRPLAQPKSGAVAGGADGDL